MKPRLHKKIRHSVFWHIFGTLLLTGLIVLLLFGGLIALFAHKGDKRPFEKNLQAYTRYIIRDLGTPPDFEKAKQLSQQLYLGIRFESSEDNWSTSEKIPTIHEAKKTFHRKHNHSFIVVDKMGTFLFYPQFKPATSPVHPLLLALFFTLVALVFLGAWLWIQRILHPLVLLNQGVQALSQGKLDHVIPIKRHDELGRLAESFNHMTLRIREMITNKDQMLMDISHEIRSPLTRMKVALELLPSSKDKRSLEDDVIEMERMINRILEAGKLENTQLHPLKTDFSLAMLITSLLKNYQNTNPPIIFTDQSNHAAINADPEQLQTVLENIIENALKYSSPDDGSIQIDLSQPASHQMLITIKDSGKGIPQEALPRIFEPFYRVDPSRAKTIDGFGLGLSICKRIIAAHEGTISIESQLGEGTMVSISLPLSA